MAQAGSLAIRELARILSGDAGLGNALAEIAQQYYVLVEQPKPLLVQNLSAELAEKSITLKYPAVSVYCERIVNELREKFRTFSGKVVLVAEVRVSEDRMENLEATLHAYVDAVTRVLDGNRGEWAPGMFYAGGYEVVIGPARHGGKNFLQSAKVRLEVNVGID